MHRNFTRLEDSKLIQKDFDGNYSLTTFGKTMCTHVPSLVYLSQNMEYFQDHDFGDVPTKFIMRSGTASCWKNTSKVFVKVIEQWKQIYKNANEYIYEALYEVPLDLIEPLIKKIKNWSKNLNYIFFRISSKHQKGRKRSTQKNLVFPKLIEKGLVERKMKDKVSTVVVLNEKRSMLFYFQILKENLI